MKRIFKVSQVIEILKAHGWQLERHKGTSHRQYKDAEGKLTTINGKLSDDVEPWLLKSIEMQTGINFKKLANSPKKRK